MKRRRLSALELSERRTEALGRATMGENMFTFSCHNDIIGVWKKSARPRDVKVKPGSVSIGIGPTDLATAAAPATTPLCKSGGAGTPIRPEQALENTLSLIQIPLRPASRPGGNETRNARAHQVILGRSATRNAIGNTPFGTSTELPSRPTMRWLSATPASAGPVTERRNCSSIIATPQNRFAGCSVTTAIAHLGYLKTTWGGLRLLRSMSVTPRAVESGAGVK
jgi:hypothetical protein